MVNYEAFFEGSEGSKHPFERPYAGFSAMGAYHASVKDMAYPTDPLTANQLKKVSDKINTGTQTIEVSGLGLTGAGPMKHLASIPRQHWKEIDRLRQLTGVELTFHGPLVESTGFSRGAWSEDQRKEAEKQMIAAVQLAQQMNSQDKEKGIVMTFHSNNGLPEVERRVATKEKNPDGTSKDEIVQMAVYNERSGQIGNLPVPVEDYLEGKKQNMTDSLDKFNEDQWKKQIESVFINNTRINRELIGPLGSLKADDDNMKKLSPEYPGTFEMYKLYNEDYETYKNGIEKVKEVNPDFAVNLSNNINNLHNVSFFVNESYGQLKELFSQAYQDLKRVDDMDNAETKKSKEIAKSKLESYRKDLMEARERVKKDYNFMELQEKITEGTRLLGDEEVKKHVKAYRPLRGFAVDKGSDTFSEVALHAYQNAKRHNIAPGIISIENPPAGMSGLTRAEEIVDLVEASRKKFINKAVERKMMSEKEATETSKKIIGATWDVGHINSIQKWGYNRKDVLEQAHKISKYVKHMHIADNLGFEDAELPIGMGNVPIAEILNAEWGENFRKAKKTVETGDWFSRQGGLGMTKTPVTESLSGLTAPVYSMGSQESPPYWNSSVHPEAGYFGGLGPISPEVHHSIYGGGFGGLPAYLGGEIPGKAANSSFSGAPLD